jgi:hypothetical protein
MVERTHVVVFGGTPAGIVAAVAAARHGAKVTLVEPTMYVGGMHTSGIATAEFEHMLRDSFSGIPLEVFRQVGTGYGFDEPLFHWESQVIEEIYRDMLDKASVTVLLGHPMDRLTVDNKRISALVLASGQKVFGEVFLDCSYEGDLMAAAGVPYTFGRESRATYGESLAGVTFVKGPGQVAAYNETVTTDEVVPVSPYVEGELLPGFSESGSLVEGQADPLTANYHFRVTLSTAQDRLPFPCPDEYDPDDYLVYARYFETFPDAGVREIVDTSPHPSGRYRVRADGRTQPLPGDKWELNNRQDRPLSLGHLGGQRGYPSADQEGRRRIYRNHLIHNQGLLYFLANDPRVSPRVRDDMAALGLPPDHYVHNQNWPPALYVREARRMLGDHVLTEADIFRDRKKPDVVAIGSHWVDCHYVQRVAVSPDGFRGEGRVWRQVTEPYQLPYSAMLPPRTHVQNLLVPVCVSASHVAFCSVRVEAQWMALAEAAGTAAATSDGLPMYDLDVPALQARLRSNGVSIPA